MSMPASGAPSAPPEHSAVVSRAQHEADPRRLERAQLHPVAQVFDQIGDWIAVLGLTYACISGRLSGELLLVGVCVVLGVQTGLRRGLGPRSMPGAGAGALVLLGLGHALAATSAAQPGYAQTRALRAVAASVFTGLAAFVIVAFLAGCPRWQRPACEAPGRYECRANQPHYCGASRQLTPVGDQPCGAGEVCALDPQGTAHCAPEVSQ